MGENRTHYGGFRGHISSWMWVSNVGGRRIWCSDDGSKYDLFGNNPNLLPSVMKKGNPHDETASESKIVGILQGKEV